jgi:hypothetical protein
MSAPLDRMAKERTRLWCGALTIPAVISIGAAVYHGFRAGHDFQWSGAHLLANHIDPYLQFLQHDPGHLILMTQVPNYLHELYVLLLPLGELPFGMARGIWVVCNLGLAAACVWLLGAIYRLTIEQVWLLATLLATSAPFRITINAGQGALLETLLLTLLLTAVAGRGPLLGLSYFKYSFSPVFVCYLAMRKRWGWLILSAAAPLLGLAIFWAMVRGNIFREAVEPFVVSRNNGVGLGMGDFMSGEFYVRQYFALKPVGMLGMLISLVGSLALGAVVAARRAEDLNAFPALICASLTLFVHLSYDYVVLVIPLAALLSPETGEAIPMLKSQRIMAGVSIGLLWYVLPSVNRFSAAIWPGFLVFPTLGLLLLCFWCMLPKSIPALAEAGLQ